MLKTSGSDFISQYFMASFLCETVDRPVGDDRVDRDIPRCPLEGRDVLQLEGYADEPGSTPRRQRLNAAESAVVVAAAHAESRAAFVEADQRQQHEIESPGLDELSGSAARLAQPVATHLQRVARGVAGEMQAAFRGIDDRQVDALAETLCETEQRPQVQLATDRPVRGERATAPEPAAACQP